MGWMSGKQPVYKFNPLKVTKTQQQDFLKRHLKMTPQQLKRFKAVAGNRNLLKPGKALTESQFQKVIKSYNSKAVAEWRAYKKEMAKKHEEYLDAKRRENVKKTRQLDRKKEIADAMIRKLTGKKSLAERRSRRAVKRPVKQDKELGVTDKERRAEAMRNRFINPTKTDWSHAGGRQAVSVFDVKRSSPEQDDDKDDKGSGEDKEIDDIKEAAKNLPDLQI